jgi:hypothetical protein
LIEVFGDEAVTQIIKVIKDLIKKEPNAEESKEATLEAGYMSGNKRHLYKRMDVGMILLGLFIEDIQMFSIRHPEVKLSEFLEAILNLDIEGASSLKPYLYGRSLWCFSTCSETLFVPSEQNQRLKKMIVERSIQILKQHKILSVQLVATRTLVRFTRKISQDDMK